MFSHIALGSNDLARTKIFYDAIMAVQGAKVMDTSKKPDRLMYIHNGQRIILITPINGQPATCANGETLGLAMTSPEQVDAWHKAGTEHGGVTAEDPPGVRHSPMGDMYLAYLRDPDGNKLCAFYKMP